MKGKEFVRVENGKICIGKLKVRHLRHDENISFYTPSEFIVDLKQELRKLVDEVIGENELSCSKINIKSCRDTTCEKCDSIRINNNDLKKEQRQRMKERGI